MVLISDIVSPRGVAIGVVGRDEMNVRSLNIEVAAWQASGPRPRLQCTSGACSCPLQ